DYYCQVWHTSGAHGFF
nr:immunoglobulin light chain junction region [Macaca mulatta]MOY05278.1 immunoglobulin light chain junction region [Macaca mulatta]MOY06532.1 immunoglobulin light chain junction region [Macaca mulatta]MOY06604.1 immunoglobulin light chain junction region [Macaca mulatta]MOY07226.1 immunoglobulin light chain junction region [Macaca mulatta]